VREEGRKKREERREERGERENHGPYSRPGRALLFALTVTVTNELTAACTGTPLPLTAFS